MTKKKIIIIASVILLIIVGIVIYIVTVNNKNADELITQYEKNVQDSNSSFLNTSLADNSIGNITEEDLELTGDKYVSADVQDISGNVVTLELKENRPMIMLFIDINNLESINALICLQQFYDEYKDNVDFVATIVADDFEEANEGVQKIIEENQITIPFVFDTVENALSMVNNMINMPSLVMINKKGEIINSIFNNINEDAIGANLDIISENY